MMSTRCSALRTVPVMSRSLRSFTSQDSTPAPEPIQKEVKEVRIPVPWGHIAGKWWGNQNIQPIIGLHGWEDNACTFDPLIPMLNVDSFLAIDIVGHGLSSHLPPGRCYNFLDFVLMVKLIQKHYGWNKLSFLGHSMGSSIAYFYAGLYPDSVDKYISIECARSLSMMFPGAEIQLLKAPIKKMFSVESKPEKNLPCYSYDEMINLVHRGSLRSISTDSCKVLMQRGAIKTSDYEKKGYFFSRDPRLRAQWLGKPTGKTILECASRIKCDVLSIRAKGSFLCDSEYEETYLQSLENIKKSAKRFEHHEVEGTHHTHLNTPENVAPIINQFLAKS